MQVLELKVLVSLGNTGLQNIENQNTHWCCMTFDPGFWYSTDMEVETPFSSKACAQTFTKQNGFSGWAHYMLCDQISFSLLLQAYSPPKICNVRDRVDVKKY